MLHAHERLIFCVTDGAANMKAAMRLIQRHLLKMLYLTCVSHGFHNISLEVKKCFTKVHKVMMGIKKVFRNSPKRVGIYKKSSGKLPPAPIEIRWGVWLNSAIYYASHDNRAIVKKGLKAVHDEIYPPKRIAKYYALLRIKKITDHELDEFKDLIDSLDDPEFIEQTEFIKENLAFLPSVIKKLENRKINVGEMLEEVNNVGHLLRNVNNMSAEIVTKYDNIFAKNEGFQVLNIYKSQNGRPEPLNKWSEYELSLLDNISMASAEVERIFSIFNQLYRNNRRSLLHENLKNLIISKCIMKEVSVCSF